MKIDIIKKIVFGVLLVVMLVVVVGFAQSKTVISQQNQVIEEAVTGDNAELIKRLEIVRMEMGIEMVNIEELKTKQIEINQNVFDAETNYNLLQAAATIIKKDLRDSFGLN